MTVDTGLLYRRMDVLPGRFFLDSVVTQETKVVSFFSQLGFVL